MKLVSGRVYSLAAAGLLAATGLFGSPVGSVSGTVKDASGAVVKPGDPDASFLVAKLRANLPARYGKHMPDTGQQLDGDQVEAMLAAIGDDGVAGIVAALRTHHHVDGLGEQVDDLALSLVAPLASDQDGHAHGGGKPTAHTLGP